MHDHVLITGGEDGFSSRSVQKYNEQGWIRDLPQMQQGRKHHGCGYYINDNNDLVRWTNVSPVLSLSFKVYLVSGGTYPEINNNVASTEVLVHGKSSWSYVGELPRSNYGLRGISFNNTVIMTGLVQTLAISLCNLWVIRGKKPPLEVNICLQC